MSNQQVDTQNIDVSSDREKEFQEALKTIDKGFCVSETDEPDNLEPIAQEPPSFEELKRQMDNKEGNGKVYERLAELQESQSYEKILEEIESIAKEKPLDAKLFLFKARALANLKRFKEADKAVLIADSFKTDFVEVYETQKEITSIKYDLYLKAGDFYLKKGIELGACLGKSNFKNARMFFEKALEISLNDINLLDNVYSVYKYLGEDKKALTIKGAIYSLRPSYKTSYDMEYNKTLCFIATYAFCEYPVVVNHFRWFRREYLLTNELGKRLNSLYVLLSPKFTRAAIGKPVLRKLFQIALLFPLATISLFRMLKKE